MLCPPAAPTQQQDQGDDQRQPGADDQHHGQAGIGWRRSLLAPGRHWLHRRGPRRLGRRHPGAQPIKRRPELDQRGAILLQLTGRRAHLRAQRVELRGQRLLGLGAAALGGELALQGRHPAQQRLPIIAERHTH